MNKIKITLLTLLSITSLSLNAFTGITLTDENHPLVIDSKKEHFKKEMQLLDRIVNLIRRTPTTTKIITSSKNKSTIEINWFINKKDIAKATKYRFDLYSGENPEVTDTSRKLFTASTNKMYFHEKPLGQDNGLTWVMNTKYRSEKINYEIYKNTKIFIKVTYKGRKDFIPLLASTTKKGCGGDIFTKEPEILCLQTSPPKEDEFTIGHSQGFTNKLTYPTLITDPNDITLSIVFFYKGAKL